MKFTSTLFNQVKTSLHELPVKHRVKLAYKVHTPNKTVNPNLNIRSHEPILFLHGVFGSKKNYQDYCQTIANTNHTPVYAIDFRNHGESEHALPLVDYSTLAQDVLHFCEDHNLKKVSVVGYSLGAKVALLTMLKSPELVSSGVIIGNAPLKTPQIKVYLKAFIKALAALKSRTSEIKVTDRDWRAKARNIMRKYVPDNDILHYLLRNVTIKTPLHNKSYTPGELSFNIPVEYYNNKVVDDIADWPEQEVEGKQFLGPVRVIRGTQSVFIDDKGLQAYKKYFPNYSLSDLNSNHLIWAERPLVVTKIVSDFLKVSRYAQLQEHTRHVEHGDVEHADVAKKAAHKEAPHHKDNFPHIDVGALPPLGENLEATVQA